MKVKWMEWLDCPFNWIQRIQINGLLVMCGAATPTPIHFILSFLPSISQFLLFYSLFCYNILSWATNQTKREGWVPSLCWLIALRGAQASPFKEWSKPSQELMKSIQLNSTHFSCLGSFLLFFKSEGTDLFVGWGPLGIIEVHKSPLGISVVHKSPFGTAWVYRTTWELCTSGYDHITRCLFKP